MTPTIITDLANKRLFYPNRIGTLFITFNKLLSMAEELPL